MYKDTSKPLDDAPEWTISSTYRFNNNSSTQRLPQDDDSEWTFNEFQSKSSNARGERSKRSDKGDDNRGESSVRNNGDNVVVVGDDNGEKEKEGEKAEDGEQNNSSSVLTDINLLIQ